MTPEQIKVVANALDNGETILVGKTKLGSEGGTWTIMHPNGHVETSPRDGFERMSAKDLIEWAEELDALNTLASAARAMGRRGGLKGGLATTDAKRAASAANGAKGGRPKKLG